MVICIKRAEPSTATRFGMFVSRFFFHLQNRVGYVQDFEGYECRDLAAAKLYAFKNIRSLLSGDAEEGTIDLRGWIDIEDESRKLVLRVPFSDAVRLFTDA